MDTMAISLAHSRCTTPRVLSAVLLGGLVAGTLDIGMAAWISGFDPATILRFIAGGVLGGPALRGGPSVAVFGLLLQWSMSIVIAAIFVFAASRLRWMLARPVPAGVACGVVVFAVMNYAVMPLSAWHRVNHFTLDKGLENLAAMVLFGLILAFTSRFLLGRRARAS